MFPVGVAAYGESTFNGYCATTPGQDNPTYAVPAMVQTTIVNAGVSCYVNNWAKDGQTLAQDTDTHVPFISTRDFIVLINSGLNDAYQNQVPNFKTTLRNLINEGRQAGKIVVIQAPNAVTASYSANVNTIRSYINTNIAGSLGVRVEPNPVIPTTDPVHPNAAGYTAMSTALTSSSNLMSPAAVKFIGLAEVVTRLYVIGLARAPERDGLDYWTNEILAGHLTEQQVATSIIAANSTYNSMTNAQYISALYLHCFNDGSADPTGQSYWVSQLNTSSRGAVALSITESAVTYGGNDPAALQRQQCFLNKIRMGLAYGLCARNNTVPSTATMSAITSSYITVTNYTSTLFPSLPT